MRHIQLVLLLALVAGVAGLAGSALAKEDAADAGKLDRTKLEVEDRLEALEIEVNYLREREAALTRYILANEQRGDGMLRVTAAARQQGFTAAAISTRSRVTLVDGMDQLAKSLQTDLPVLTEEQMKALVDLDEWLAKRPKKTAE